MSDDQENCFNQLIDKRIVDMIYDNVPSLYNINYAAIFKTNKDVNSIA